MKKLILVMITVLTIGAILSACSSNTPNSSDQSSETEKTQDKVKLVMLTNATGAVFEAEQGIIANFMKENPNIEVDFSTQGKDYEQLMKAKMAANDLPDVFATHGWSVNRYKEYLRPLEDQAWSKNIVDSLKSTITDEAGHIYVLPMNLDQSGFVYNRKVLEDLNLEIPNNWDEFIAASKVIKAAGITPVQMGDKDPTKLASFLDKVAPVFLITDKDHNYGDALKDGTFDWSKWNQVSQLLLDLYSQEFINKDILTADPVTTAEKLAQGKAAFAFESNGVIAQALKTNPDAKLGMMPIPAFYEGDEPILNGGEKEAYGIGKDSKHIEEALKLLTFMSKPENVQAVSTASGLPAAFNGVENKLGDLSGDYAKYADLRTIPVFDREYLPSGMWSTLQVAGSSLLVSGGLSVEQVSDLMKEDYMKFRAQQK
ncbi:extracellular solute-binding protein [Paenibacillus sonchi]|uniref:Extracellular solute-binding protein n=1 Tax=Paenibacillus sonchi TaxID=373687 RepID=A0A974PDB4_9BACL|nr:extracellular solute-binding protein [Paenibacillus sonchi]QQZ61293.1 extracellular solute-binding protein [Paenibacillus sonchi]